jgi:LysM repeat protein
VKGTAMSRGIDYSWARPGGNSIKQAGFDFACRYLSHDDGKTITQGEASDLINNGVDIVLVYESYATRPLAGHDAGVQDGQTAVAEAQAIGFAGDTIYAAADFDATEAQQALIDSYLHGFTEGLGGKYQTGVYGGFYVVKRCKENGTATKFWQTLAWSGGQILDGVHIYQNGQTTFGGGADIDEGRQDNIGQWKADGSHPAPSPAPAPAPAPSGGGSYTVVPGDTLSGIAQRFGTTYQVLAQINGISNPNLIKAGQVIKLPGGAPTPQPNGQVYTVAAGDTLSGIGTRFGVDWHTIQQVNNIPDANKIYVGQVLRIPGTVPVSSPTLYYTVQSGDTLSAIANRYHTSYQQLASLNNISNPNLIYAGQVLRIN